MSLLGLQEVSPEQYQTLRAQWRTKQRRRRNLWRLLGSGAELGSL